MNVEVLGSDYMGGGVTDFFTQIGKTVGDAFKSDTGKTITGMTLQAVGSRMTPTQKAQYSQAQQAFGLPPMPVNNSTPVLAQPSTLETAAPYMIIGGALLVGLIFMFATKR